MRRRVREGEIDRQENSEIEMNREIEAERQPQG